MDSKIDARFTVFLATYLNLLTAVRGIALAPLLVMITFRVAFPACRQAGLAAKNGKPSFLGKKLLFP
jgi:hypothetical protein